MVQEGRDNNQLCHHWPLHLSLPPHTEFSVVIVVVVIVVAVFINIVTVDVFGAGPVMVVVVVVFVVVVGAFVNVIAVVLCGAGRPPNGLLSPCHPPNGENESAGV